MSTLTKVARLQIEDLTVERSPSGHLDLEIDPGGGGCCRTGERVYLDRTEAIRLRDFLTYMIENGDLSLAR